jgi:hypothetical protein
MDSIVGASLRVAVLVEESSIPRLKVEQSQLATQNLMMIFKSTVKRNYGNGSKFPKLHLPCHFLENMLDLGVIANVDSGPPESNHKPNARHLTNTLRCEQIVLRCRQHNGMLKISSLILLQMHCT